MHAINLTTVWKADGQLSPRNTEPIRDAHHVYTPVSANGVLCLSPIVLSKAEYKYYQIFKTFLSSFLSFLLYLFYFSFVREGLSD